MADVDIDREALRKEIDAALHGKKKEPQPPAGFELNQHSSVKHVIGVVSGKGGVGKSFVTGILATNLARAGKRVGILDGDITGPSIPRMFGISDERSYGVEEQLIPIEDANGIKIMSANLVLQNETDPVLWRGPVVAGAIQQFYSQCNWGDLDYLLIDMPPGTGDVALTVFQSLPVEGVVIVSSPQDLVQMVVGKAVRMAEMMLEPYGPSKLAETAAAFNLKPLGQLPMDATFAQIADKGTFSTELPQGLVPNATQSVLDL